MPKSRDDKPERSWREIDAMRSGGRGGGRQQAPRDDRSQAYRAYKSQLNKLFDGSTPLPETLRERLGGDVAAGARQQKELAKAIVDAASPAELEKALVAYEAVYGFPQDEDVLARIIDHTDAARVVQAIEALEGLHAGGGLKRARSLKTRIAAAKLTLDDPDVEAAAGRLLPLL